MIGSRPVQLTILFVLTAAVFLAVDALWIWLVAGELYESHLGPLLAVKVRPVPAALFYVIYTGGLLVLAILPGLAGGSWRRAAGLGAVLGLTAYATFALTCYALFQDYPWILATADPAWGAVLSALTACSGYGLGRWMGLGKRP